jgi:uncharacterized membrane protein YeaQ/YmgE (transglycosylase-associated protein family)
MAVSAEDDDVKGVNNTDDVKEANNTDDVKEANNTDDVKEANNTDDANKGGKGIVGDIIGGILGGLIGEAIGGDDDNGASKIDLGQVTYFTIGAYVIQQIITHQI